jgi:predicted ATPase
MIGRDRELSKVRSLVEHCQTKRAGHVLLIKGEPGVGKSRLLSEVAAAVSFSRGTVLTGRSYEAEARRPYRPWIDAIQSLHPSVVGQVLGDALSPLLTGVFSDDEQKGGRDRLFAAIVELLAARAHSASPVLLQLDDIQWCDEASAELLHYVVRMTRHRPVFVLLAARSGELPDNPALMRVLRSFRRDRWMEELAVEPLSAKDTAQLARMVSPAMDTATVFDETAGNPLYTIEAARAADDGNRHGDGTLAGLIRDRVDRLPSTAADVLKWLAVLGSNFTLDRAASLTPLSPDELTDALELLERHALLKDSGFSHNIVRRSVYDDLSEPRRRLMHRRAAQVLAAESDKASAAAEVAHHAALAGEAALAARASVEAGRYCVRLYANTEAQAFARSGSRHAEGLPERERVSLQIELMEVSFSAGRPKEIDDTAKELEELSERALLFGDIEHARLGFRLLSYLRWEGGDWSGAQRHSLRAELVSRKGGQREQVVAMAETALCLAMLERDMPQAEALALEARTRAAHDGIETVAIPDAIGMLRLHQGDWEEAERLFHSARELARREGDPMAEFRALEHLVVLELERGNPGAALLPSKELCDLAAKLREGSEAPFARCLAALTAEAAGENAAKEIDLSLQSLRMADAKHRLAYALLRAAVGDLSRKDADRARARAEEALRLADILDRPSERVMAHVVLLRSATLRNSRPDIERHRNALTSANTAQLAAYVRQAAAEFISSQKGATRGTRARGTKIRGASEN